MKIKKIQKIIIILILPIFIFTLNTIESYARTITANFITDDRYNSYNQNTSYRANFDVATSDAIQTSYNYNGWQTYIDVYENGSKTAGGFVQSARYSGGHTIGGLNVKTRFNYIDNNSESLQVIYTVTNTTSTAKTFHLTTGTDLMFYGNDHCDVDIIKNASGQWTGFYMKHNGLQLSVILRGTSFVTDTDTLYVANWYDAQDWMSKRCTNKVQNLSGIDSCYNSSWTNRTIQPGEEQEYIFLIGIVPENKTTEAKYYANHFLQNADRTYPSTPTYKDEYIGTIGANVTPPIKTFAGYTTPATQTIIVDANGYASVAYYYPLIPTTTVIFNKNDNSGSTASQTFTYGASGNRFGYNTDGTLKWGNSGQFGAWDRAGYTLLGWSENFNATSKTYDIYSNVSNEWIDSKYPNINLYAVWQTIGYKITLNENGGNNLNDINYNVETATFNLPIPIRTGYTFTGWTGSNGTTPQKTVTINKGTIGNKSYTANWEITKYDINTTAGTGGIISNKVSKLQYKGDTSIHIIPMSGYQISNVTIDGVSKGAISTYDFWDIDSNHTVIASFTKTSTLNNYLNALKTKYSWITFK